MVAGPASGTLALFPSGCCRGRQHTVPLSAPDSLDPLAERGTGRAGVPDLRVGRIAGRWRAWRVARAVRPCTAAAVRPPTVGPDRCRACASVTLALGGVVGAVGASRAAALRGGAAAVGHPVGMG